jgi:hypothetical protein
MPMCPKCEQPIPRMQLDLGSMFVVCGYRKGGKRCGQRLHILGTGHGVCVVVGLTKEEYEYYTKRQYLVPWFYEELGILATLGSQGNLPAA